VVSAVHGNHSLGDDSRPLHCDVAGPVMGLGELIGGVLTPVGRGLAADHYGLQAPVFIEAACALMQRYWRCSAGDGAGKTQSRAAALRLLPSVEKLPRWPSRRRNGSALESETVPPLPEPRKSSAVEMAVRPLNQCATRSASNRRARE